MKIFAEQSIFGLDVSDHSIECLLLFNKGREIRVKSYSKVELTPGIVENGIILNKGVLAEKIAEAWVKAKPKRIASKKVIISLPESRSFIHIFKSSEILKGANIKEGIIFEASKIIPIDLQETYNDFIVYKNGDIFFAAVSKKVINGYLEVIKEAKLELVAVDMESLSIGRVLFEIGDFPPKADQPRAEKESFMVADIGGRTTNLSIFNQSGELQTSTTINVAGNKFTQAIAEEAGVDFEKAEKLKITYGLDDKGDQRVFEVLKKEILPIIEKIKELIEYCQGGVSVQNGSALSVEKILLVGGSARMPKIASYFSKNLNVKVELGKSKISEQIKEFAPCENVIGLALRGLQDMPDRAGINLLPLIGKKKSFLRVFFERKIKLWITAVLLIVEALFFLIGFKFIFDQFDNLVEGIKINKYNNIMEQQLHERSFK
ncbi:MAG: pilus assembly protein PilM [Patescibacteria group bacterium]